MIKSFIKKLSLSLYSRLAFTLFCSFTLVSVFSISLFVHTSHTYQQEITQRMHNELAAHVTSHYLLFKNDKPDLEAAKHTFHDLMILGPNFEFYVLDNNGHILSYSTDPQKIKREYVDTRPIQHYLANNNLRTPIVGDDPRSTSRKKIFSASPIMVEGKQMGYLYVILGSEIYDNLANVVGQSKIIQWGLAIFIGGLLFSLICTLWLTGVITKPLTRLLHQINTTREQGFAHNSQSSAEAAENFKEWNTNSNNEIHAVGAAFRDLINKLEEQYNTVITVDELRKELLSHVSHDLRTPLASLLGYLETWEMNKDTLTTEQTELYISTAKRNAQKISRLVEQLFELAYLDGGNVQVNKEKIVIAELVQDVLQKFYIAAQEKNISLAVSPQDSRIEVMGDIEKLDRVFSNLIENALRHTPDGGSIIVRLQPKAQYVSIEVSDTGIGIPKSDITRIFDPHFKAGNSIRGNSANGGLGLAITRRLLDLHQAKIKVASEENKGTTFCFELQAG
ncbi:HAMP domain-containing sensor histidine kinase [Saccharophagus degradans]|uniref:sensor histidine kinase n=1 Tax=Saccharophagus degradans TaxID=86304 RepID=UPI002477D7A0|nr:HAMP domain-containing sensor histidine kinase [Saccharophagus degradans]WGO98858.1 HAMP domain-containing sensor histidine kinase [Saccharophagus degradans]